MSRPAAVPVSPVRPYDPTADARAELHRQVDVLVGRGYPALLGLDETAFRETLAPLAAVAEAAPATTAVDPADHLPFVVVVAAAPVTATAPLMRLGARPAVTMMDDAELVEYVPIPSVQVPDGVAYLLLDVDTGSDLCSVRPGDALPVLEGRGRSPLTVAEGVALVTVRPDMLRPNRCFSLLASRRGDKRVPAIWISAGAPKLGWCWNGNPHTWLGSASTGSRAA